MKDDSILESVFTESWINESNENYSIDDKYITLESLLLDFEEYDNIATEGIIDKFRAWRERNKVYFHKRTSTFLTGLNSRIKILEKQYSAIIKRQRNGKDINPKKVGKGIATFYTLDDIKKSYAIAEKTIIYTAKAIKSLTSKSPIEFGTSDKFNKLSNTCFSLMDNIRNQYSIIPNTKVITNKKQLVDYGYASYLFNIQFVNLNEAKTISAMDYMKSFKTFSSYIESATDKLLNLVENSSYEIISNVQKLIERSEMELKSVKKEIKNGTKVKSDANQLKYAKKAIKIIQKFVYSRLQDFRAIYSLFTSMVISACGNYATAMRF